MECPIFYNLMETTLVTQRPWRGSVQNYSLPMPVAWELPSIFQSTIGPTHHWSYTSDEDYKNIAFILVYIKYDLTLHLLSFRWFSEISYNNSEPAVIQLPALVAELFRPWCTEQC